MPTRRITIPPPVLSATATVTPSATVTSTPLPTETPLPSLTPTPDHHIQYPIRALRLDVPNDAQGRGQMDALEIRMRQAGINLVALGAGRVDWTYFKWPGYETQWSSDVTDSKQDFLLEDSQRFGQWAHVNAVVDVYAPRYIESHPEQVALSWLGKRSPYLVNTMDLVDGEFGQLLLKMIEYVAENYPVDSISITELVYYTDGYSDKDKAAYLAYTGRNDWPRLANGLVNIDHPSIGEWRTYEISRFLEKASRVVHNQGKLLFLDVGVSWGALQNAAQENGTGYNAMLEYVDKLVVWDYFALNGYRPEYTETIAQYLSGFGQERIILSIGLWDTGDTTISADQLIGAMQASIKGGISNLWVTPSHLLTSQHWEQLTAFGK